MDPGPVAEATDFKRFQKANISQFGISARETNWIWRFCFAFVAPTKRKEGEKKTKKKQTNTENENSDRYSCSL